MQICKGGGGGGGGGWGGGGGGGGGGGADFNSIKYKLLRLKILTG